MFLLIYQTISWSSFCLIFPSRFLSSSINWLSTILFQNFVCYGHASFVRTLCMISDSIRLYGQFSMGGHIIPDAEKSNTIVWTHLQGLYQLLTRFCPHCKLRRLQPLGIIVNLIISFKNTCWVLKNVQQPLLLRYLKSAEAYNGKKKYVLLGGTRCLKYPHL